jgi:RNA polymerase sigma-70 factor (ECF subfamily)
MQGSDDELMVAIVAGDRDAFAALYRRRRPDVYRFAVHMTGEPALAEDVTHDVFLAVIESAQQYTAGRSGVVPWLLGIARNQARRRLSRDWRLESLPEPDDQEKGARAEVADPVEDLAREREIGALREALSTLPVPYREVVVLCDLQELSYVEAAETVGCAIGTIRSRLHRGRSLLAARLRGEGRPFVGRSTPGWVI